MPSTIIAPLAIPDSIDCKRILHLNPDLLVDGAMRVLLAQDLAAVPRSALRHPVTNLSSQREEILAAFDFLFTGF